MNYKLLTFLLLAIFIVELVIIFSPDKSTQEGDGKWITYSYQIDNETIVYYKGFVNRIGVSEFNLIAVCSEIEKRCSEPNKQEIIEDKYIPQSEQ